MQLRWSRSTKSLNELWILMRRGSINQTSDENAGELKEVPSLCQGKLCSQEYLLLQVLIISGKATFASPRQTPTIRWWICSYLILLRLWIIKIRIGEKTQCFCLMVSNIRFKFCWIWFSFLLGAKYHLSPHTQKRMGILQMKVIFSGP